MTEPGRSTKGRPVAKPRRLDAPAYVLRLLEDGRWLVVESAAGQTCRVAHARAQATYVETVPEGADPMAAMVAEAKRREAWVVGQIEARGEKPDDHVTTFLAVSLAEASQMTGIPVAGARKRKAAPDGG